MTTNAFFALGGRFREVWHLAAGVAALVLVTLIYRGLVGISNPTVVAFSYLLVILLLAAASTLRVAVAASVLAVLAVNFYFLPPVGTFTIADPQNWVALLAFLAVSFVASRLSLVARQRADEAMARRDEAVRLLEELRESERVRRSAELNSALLASLGHDLKTPLTAITVAASNLRAPGLTDDLRREQLDVVLSEIVRLNRLFENIVDMARIETGALDAERDWVHPADVIEAAVRQVEGALAEHPIDLDVTTNLVPQIDPRLTSAALAHLLENAGQYAPPGSRITVTSRVDETGVVFSVRDRGPGVSPRDREYLFQRFYRGAGARQRTFGTGMGLAITKGLLAAEGGRVWVENHKDGGAIFSIAIDAPVRAEALVPQDAE